MKLSEFKRSVSIRMDLLWANTIFTFQQETAYWLNNWTAVFSAAFFMVSTIIFINVLFTNTNTVAGYAKDEMLLFILIGQSVYYVGWVFSHNFTELISSVNKGSLDLVLIKPVPSLFYVQFRKIKLFSEFRNVIIPSVTLVWVINWSSLNVAIPDLITGIFIAFMGLIIANTIYLLSSLPVFWVGESAGILDTIQQMEYTSGRMVPYDAFSGNLRFFLTYVFPSLIPAGVATSVMLGKTPAYPMVFVVMGIMSIFLILRVVMWKKALRVYSSASS